MRVEGHTVESCLVGRWASGHWSEWNPAYVSPFDRKWLKKYPPEAFEPHIWHFVTEQVVAVSQTGGGTLRVWVLVDGLLRELHESSLKIMPAGWVPGIR